MATTAYKRPGREDSLLFDFQWLIPRLALRDLADMDQNPLALRVWWNWTGDYASSNRAVPIAVAPGARTAEQTKSLHSLSV